MRIDIMTDIETLGTDTDSTIIQIAAIAFDITTGKIYTEFNGIANINKNTTPIKVTGDTIQWWMRTNPQLFGELLNSGTHSSEQLLAIFHTWLSQFTKPGNYMYLWGNGILFDNKMIQSQLESIGLDYPVFYRNDRDLRTLVELASLRLGMSEKDLRERWNDDSLTAHNALDDVKYQINVAVGCMNIIMGRSE